MSRAWVSVVLCCLLPAAAQAELKLSAPGNALVEHRFRLAVPPTQAWQVLVHPESWWPEDHTWSGSRDNLSLVPRAGGCFCEAWPSGSAEHARVVMAMEGRLLRIRGAFGPLQEMAVTAVLTVALAPVDGGSEAVVTYRISGDPSHALDQFAPVVDQVIGQQFGDFARRAGLMTTDN